ncbi:5-oxoprolinase [Oopsacas minuta]|uniref:5-oxoprolinase n=1 Tax=Oopsacas minuta TaxID=111878 RepID=A0AAV7JNI6_9METZ|nr:5-oxoprolinase [Oopsacas minuta]
MQLTCPNGKIHGMKLLSEDTQRYVDAPREAIRRILSQESGVDYPKEKPIPTDLIGNIRMGTTIATNALLERRGTKTALVITKGFRDLLHIGNKSRPSLFNLSVQTPEWRIRRAYRRINFGEYRSRRVKIRARSHTVILYVCSTGVKMREMI